MSIGYYPIKESEIKQTIKMVSFYYKKDSAAIEEILAQYNVNDGKKKDVYKSIEECIKNKNSQYFEQCLGLCVAKIQKIYRGNFILQDKSITTLMKMYPMMNKYKSNMGDVVKFKNDRYQFLNELKSDNSSGVFISYENIEKLYNDYYMDIKVRKTVDDYYGVSKTGYDNKFIEILDYCLKNECGLLEANFAAQKDSSAVTSVQPKESVHPAAKENAVASGNSVDKLMENANIDNKNIQTGSTSNKRNREVVNAKTMTQTLIITRGLIHIPLAIIFGIVMFFMIFTIRIPLIRLFIYGVLTAILEVVAWHLAVDMSFKNRTIEKIDISKIMKMLAGFMAVLIIFTALSNYLKLSNGVSNLIESGSSQISSAIRNIKAYGTDEQKKQADQYKKELKKAVMKELMDDFIDICIVDCIVGFGSLMYARYRIRSVVDR